MGSGRGGNATSYAANPADGCCRKPRAYSDRARDLLGADGLRYDGRHHRRYAADAVVLASALRRMVPDQEAECYPGSRVFTSALTWSSRPAASAAGAVMTWIPI